MTSSISLTNKSEQRFQNLLFLTVISIYLLILAGGIVRATGSGMGCPDWPRCFGRWIPPTNLAQLPTNYQEIYGAKLKGEVEFNAVKTWIEYVNRLLGVLAGFFVFGTLLTSFTYWHKDRAIVWSSLIAFLLVGANGWLGSRVVASELAHYLITAHLLLAILVVFALLFSLVRTKVTQNQPLEGAYVVRWLLLVVIILTMGQIVLGTQVRSALDTIIRQIGYAQRMNWINQLGTVFYVHRSFSLFLLIVNLIVVYQLRNLKAVSWFTWIPTTLLILILLEIFTGVLMAYFGVSALAQPIHLILAVSIISLQFVAILLINPFKVNTEGEQKTARFVRI